MRSFIHERRRFPVVPILVALFQLALVTWIPFADAVHHSGGAPISVPGEPGDGQGDGARLTPVCFICAAYLGVFSSAAPDLAPTVSTGSTPPLEPTPKAPPSSQRISTHLARAPPSA